MTMTMLETGQLAPEFRLRGPGGQWVTLSEYRNQKHVVLVFYPLAFSPVCSHQLPDIQKRLREFESLGATVFGISVDSHYANEAFARSLGLEFPLLSDFKRQAMTAYSVLNAELGRSERALFLVDKTGHIAYQDVSPTADLVPSNDRVIEALRRLKG
jgi:peroxiredoxin